MRRVARTALKAAAGLILLSNVAVAQVAAPLVLSHVRYSSAAVFNPEDTFVVAPLDRQQGDDAIDIDLSSWISHRNQGNGEVRLSFSSIPLAIWLGATAIDVERDGDLDVVAVTNGREPILLLNDGSANFTLAPAGTRFPGSPVSGYRVAAADVDGDGFDDLLIGAVTNYPSLLWRNDGTGRFVDITATHLPTWNGTVADIQPVDIDRDGDIDFVLAQGYGVGVADHNGILLNQGGGHFTFQPLVSLRRTHAWAAVADFTGDGLPDIVFGNPIVAGAEYWINMGGGQFFDATPQVGNLPQAMDGAAGDLDGDGWPDLLVSSYAGVAHLEIHLNQRGQGFTLMPNGVAQLYPQFTVGNIELRDMDGDGDIDAVVRGSYLFPLPGNIDFWVLPNTTRHVLTDPTVPSGGTYRMTLWARPQDFVVPALAGAHVATDLGSLGTLGLDPASLVALPAVPMTAWSHALTIPVPTTPWLIGRRIWAQAAVVSPTQPLAPRLTNWLDTQIVR